MGWNALRCPLAAALLCLLLPAQARAPFTGLELVSRNNQMGLLTLSDSTGKRYSVSTGGNTSVPLGNIAPAAAHITLSTPLVLPVGSQLQVSVEDLMGGSGDFEVNLIGRIVNL
jgi:hypothetical protein